MSSSNSDNAPIDMEEQEDSFPSVSTNKKRGKGGGGSASLRVDIRVAEAAAVSSRNNSSNNPSSMINSNNNSNSGSGSMINNSNTNTNSNRAGRKSGASTPAASFGNMTPTTQDQHPYARGSVIEVWHKPSNNAIGQSAVASSSSSSSWWSDPDSSDDEPENTTTSTETENNAATATIRMCDIIDRRQYNDEKTGAVVWRYYIHYRDFNRRMDEWITLDRIVSPPSVGNAKARALKREEEKRQKRQREEAAAAAAAALTPRGRRRTAIQQQQQQQQQQQSATPAATVSLIAGTSSGGASAGPGGGLVTAEDDTEGGRRTRLSRRKSAVTDDDAATVVTSNYPAAEEAEDAVATNKFGAHAATTMPAKASGSGAIAAHTKHKEIVVADTVTTHTVGEHVVATLQAQELDEHEGLDEASLREHEEVTKVKNVAFMELGYHQMETWYFSPLPKELVGPSGFVQVLYVCEFTLSLFARKSELRRFQARLPTHARHPPGNEIYRKDNLAMFEVDGLEEKIYSQNLCYIAKLFLDHKTLYFDVDPFLFYVLCEVDERGHHPVGYFSKEKYSDVGYNLACILTFPAHQRKGYGRFLIAFSYELSKKEEKVGSPEKPMSDLGQQAYKPYWASTIIDFLLHQSDESTLSVMDISKRTSIMAEDIVFTLNQLGLLKMMNGVYFIAAEVNLLQRLALKYPIKNPRIDPAALHWTPFLTDIKRDKFSIHSKKASVLESAPRTTPLPGTAITKA